MTDPLNIPQPPPFNKANVAKWNKATEARVSKLFHQYCTGITIPILKLPALMKLGVEAANAGKDDGAIGIILYENAVRFGKEG